MIHIQIVFWNVRGFASDPSVSYLKMFSTNKLRLCAIFELKIPLAWVWELKLFAGIVGSFFVQDNGDEIWIV